MAGQQTLNLFIVVRIHVSEPSKTQPSGWVFDGSEILVRDTLVRAVENSERHANSVVYFRATQTA